MNLSEFIAEERQRLDAFEKWYRNQMAEGPIDDSGCPVFPAEMGSVDWDEQLQFFDPSEIASN
jgi:hypothetical protein